MSKEKIKFLDIFNNRKDRYRVVENEKGWGTFEVQTKVENNLKSAQKVLPIEGTEKAYEAFQQDQFSEGNPIAIFRYGSRGRCRLNINTEAINVESIMVKNLIYPPMDSIVYQIKYNEHHVPEEDFSKDIIINPIPIKDFMGSEHTAFKIKGKTLDGLKIEAAVVYKPSLNPPETPVLPFHIM